MFVTTARPNGRAIHHVKKNRKSFAVLSCGDTCSNPVFLDVPDYGDRDWCDACLSSVAGRAAFTAAAQVLT